MSILGWKEKLLTSIIQPSESQRTLWSSQTGFGLPVELACYPRSFSFLWAAGTGRSWWSISWTTFQAHCWLQGPQGHTLRVLCPVSSFGPLWSIRHSCKLHHVKYFCKLLISVLFQFASRTLWGWLRFQWACASLVSVGDTVGPKTGNSFEEWCFEARGYITIYNWKVVGVF